MAPGLGWARRALAAAALLSAVAGCTDATVSPVAMVSAATPGRPISCPGGGASWLVPFKSAPFPYSGDFPGKGPFYDRTEGERRGRTSPRGGLYWEDETYSDNRVLLSVPGGFDPSRPAAIVVYMHGNQSTLERDVCGRQRVPAQLAASGLNAVLVAPQFARDALDSSAGRFWDRGAFRAFLSEAARNLSALTGRGGFDGLPVIVVAYSGGYFPAVSAIEVGGIGDRLRGIVLMDALYGEAERYAAIVAGQRPAFVSAYSTSAKEQNDAMRRLLSARGIASGEGLPASLRPGTVAFVPAGPEVSHADFMTQAFTADPLRAVLDRFDGFRRGGAR